MSFGLVGTAALGCLLLHGKPASPAATATGQPPAGGGDVGPTPIRWPKPARHIFPTNQNWWPRQIFSCWCWIWCNNISSSKAMLVWSIEFQTRALKHTLMRTFAQLFKNNNILFILEKKNGLEYYYYYGVQVLGHSKSRNKHLSVYIPGNHLFSCDTIRSSRDKLKERTCTIPSL